MLISNKDYLFNIQAKLTHYIIKKSRKYLIIIFPAFVEILFPVNIQDYWVISQDLHLYQLGAKEKGNHALH